MKKLLYILLAILGVSAISVATIVTLDAAGAIELVPRTRLEASFYNYDESFLWSTYFDYGDSVVYQGPVPSKEEDEDSKYTFVSWDKSLNDLTESTNFYAKFKKEDRDYKCTFRNFNGLELFVSFVPRGGTATYYGVAPERPKTEYNSFRFKGWDKPLDDIREDTIFTAQYEEIPLEYEVKFLNYDGNVLYVDNVAAGETAVYVGMEPVRESANFIDYEFSGWDKDLNHVFESFSTTALFTELPVRYKVTFINYDGTLLFTDYVSNGGTAHYIGSTPYRPADEHYVYTFDTWNKDLKNIHSDLTVSPIFTKRERDYLVVFKDSNGTVLQESSTKYNTAVKYLGPTPTKDMDEKYEYVFSGWDRDIEHVISDLETYPVFTKTLRKYDCHFFNYDGAFLKTIKCEYGKTVHYDGETPYKPTNGNIAYVFNGWDKSLENIRCETTFTAVFVEEESSEGAPTLLDVVAFYGYCTKPTSEDILDYDIIAPGKKASFDDRDGYPPRKSDSKGSYTFVSWDKQEWVNSMPDFSFATFPQYECWDNYGQKYYIVSYRDNNGVLLYEDFVLPGEATEYRGEITPSLQPNNYFVGWANYIVWDEDLQMNVPQYSFDLNNITESITLYPLHNR